MTLKVLFHQYQITDFVICTFQHAYYLDYQVRCSSQNCTVIIIFEISV